MTAETPIRSREQLASDAGKAVRYLGVVERDPYASLELERSARQRVIRDAADLAFAFEGTPTTLSHALRQVIESIEDGARLAGLGQDMVEAHEAHQLSKVLRQFGIGL